MLVCRLATSADVPALRSIMGAAIDGLQADYLDNAQVVASHRVMGLDSQLIADATYFVAECDGAIAGCGGWSRRRTLYGGDDGLAARLPDLLDPSVDAARVRAMYTSPPFARRGVGRAILTVCETAARAEGFARVELMATLAGAPLYRACGFTVIEHSEHVVDDVTVPLIRMDKAL